MTPHKPTVALAHLRRNVIAYLALFVALGGTSAYAASELLPKNSVGAKQLRKAAVTAKKIRPDAVTGAAVADRSLGTDDLAPGTIPGAPDLSGFYSKQEADQRFIERADADAQFLRATPLAIRGAIVPNGQIADVLTVPGRGALSVWCDRTGIGRALYEWNPAAGLSAPSRIWWETGSGDAYFNDRVHNQNPRASLQASARDRSSLEVFGPDGTTTQLTVLTHISDSNENGGFCEIDLVGMTVPAS